LNALRGSKEPLFHIGAGAKGVIRNDLYAKLNLRESLSFLLFLQARICGRAAIYGRVAAMQKNVAL